MDYARFTNPAGVRGCFSVRYAYNTIDMTGLEVGADKWLVSAVETEEKSQKYITLTYQPHKRQTDKKIKIDNIEYTIKYDNGYITNELMTSLGNFTEYSTSNTDARNNWALNGFHLARRGVKIDPFTKNDAATDDPLMSWQSDTDDTGNTEMKSFEFNKGKTQTNWMADDATTGRTYPAADYCRKMGSDYYMLSVSELNWMYNNAKVYLGNSYSFSSSTYWSATEYNVTLSRGVDFSNGFVSSNIKTNDYASRARCVRDL